MQTHSLPDLKKTDTGWTLFLDRDGVINYEKKMDYILNWDEFKFYEEVPQMMSILSKKFGRIIIVSNQRGVGKGLMSDLDLSEIHDKLNKQVAEAGGRIDRIYVCTSTDNNHLDRKPNPGMALKARKDFPEIDFSRSLMVGNRLSDMAFGRKTGMFTVFLDTTNPETAWPHPDIDFRFGNLPEFVKAL